MIYGVEATSNAGGDHGGLEGPQGKQGRWSSGSYKGNGGVSLSRADVTEALDWRGGPCDYAAPKLRQAALMPRMVDRRK